MEVLYMQYKDFGKTGIKISALGFGAMRLPEYEQDGKWYMKEDESIQIVHRAFDLGVNYIDTAYTYCHNNCEYVIGKALKGYRDKVYLSTKMPTWLVKKKDDYRRFLEEQLKKLDVDYIDFYYFHSLNKNHWENIVLKFNLIEEAEKAKSEGLIKHISFSFHDSPEVLKMLVDTGIFESVLCQYNLIDRSNEEAIAYAASKGLGTVIMGPVGGGRLAAPSDAIANMLKRDIKSTPEIALRFVLGNENVNCALSGMNTIEMVEQNVQIASSNLTLYKEDWDKINAMIKETQKLSELYCTGCNYCMPCPKGINIPNIFSLMNQHKVFGLTEIAKKRFAKIIDPESKEVSPAECSECGACEKKCPQKLPIRVKLKETLQELSN